MLLNYFGIINLEQFFGASKRNGGESGLVG